MFIYKITNSLNGKIYIGKTTKTIEKRFKDHIGDAKANRGYALHAAMRKYGVENFNIEKICSCKNEDKLNLLEIYFIKRYDAIKLGYNLNTGGQGGRNELACIKLGEFSRNRVWTKEEKDKIGDFHRGKKISKENILAMKVARKPQTEENKLKLSERMKSNNPMNSKEHRDKMANSLVGRRLSKEHKDKISIRIKGEGNPFYGKKHSPEARAKMSEAMRKRNADLKSKTK